MFLYHPGLCGHHIPLQVRVLQAVLSSVAKAESPRRYRGVSWQESTDLKEIFSFSVSSVGMCSGGLVLRLREKQKAVHDLLAVFFWWTLPTASEEEVLLLWAAGCSLRSGSVERFGRVCWRLPVSHGQDNSGWAAWTAVWGKYQGITGFISISIPFSEKFSVLAALSDQVVATQARQPTSENRGEVASVAL